MGSCPYCQSVTYPGDTICYSCGRVLANLRSKSFAMEQQFNHGSKETTYKMTKKPTGRGVIQTHTGRSKNIMKRRWNKSRLLVVVVFLAFVFTSPVVQEATIGQIASIKETLYLKAAPARVYPMEVDYEVTKTIQAQNNGAEGYLVESLIIPSDVASLNGSEQQYAYTDNSSAMLTTNLQSIASVNVIINGGAPIAVPLDGLPIRSAEDKIITAAGHEVWWPGYGPDGEQCGVSSCVKVQLNLAPGQSASIAMTVGLKSTSYSWWDSGRVDSRINGIDEGIKMGTSGNFDDMSLRDAFGESQQYRGQKWYDRGVSPILDSRSLGGWAINAQNDDVTALSNQIIQSLPEGESENAYGYARAVFDYLHANAEYDRNAPIIARSGPECLAAGLGDCDEQTNAFLSLLRVKGMPGWYAFGALTDANFLEWEAHAWAYIQLPFSEEYCAERNIVLSQCYVQGQVDVVNNKWLLHTPTAYVAWIEQPDASGDLLNAYYQPAWYTTGVDRSPPVYTSVVSEMNGGSYRVPVLAENLG